MGMGKNKGRIVGGFLALLLVVFTAGSAFSGVNVNINIGPPDLVVAGPPEMIVVPRTMVYFAPGVAVDLFFCAGYWWAPKEGHWFRARAYNGPWGIVASRAVPAAIVRLPKNYRKIYAHEHQIPYGQLKKHHELRDRDRRHGRGEWGGWEKNGKHHRKKGR